MAAQKTAKPKPKIETFGQMTQFFNLITPLAGELLSSNDADKLSLDRQELGVIIARDANREFREDLELPPETKLSWKARKFVRRIRMELKAKGVYPERLHRRQEHAATASAK